MYCVKCGAKLEERITSCENCGQRMVEQGKLAKGKNKSSALTWIFAGLSLLLAIMLALVLILPVNIASSGLNSIGFDTPEEAIEYFIDCINNGDVESALRVSYAEKAAENYDFEQMAEQLRAVYANMPMPTEYEFYIVFNEYKFNADLLNQIRELVLSLTRPEYASVYLGDETPIFVDNKADYKGTDPTLLEPIEIIEIVVPRSDLYYESIDKNVFSKHAEAYGADSVELRNVLYKYNGNYYCGGFQLMEYDGQYYIASACEILIGQRSGSLMPLSKKSDFDYLIE